VVGLLATRGAEEGTGGQARVRVSHSSILAGQAAWRHIAEGPRWLTVNLMVARQESPHDDAQGPEEFRAAVAAMRTAHLRPEVHCEEMPAPQRIAPWSAALTADVDVDDTELGTGRLILLHEPNGNDAWEGTFRCVAYARAEVDPELGQDPMLGAVGWSWLTDALEAHGAEHVVASGTVTRVTTESFGTMADEAGTAQVEIRASWTPVVDEHGHVDMASHVEAWGELLCTAVGLPPVPEGVTAIPSRRGQRG
jgi:hypothetical protein